VLITCPPNLLVEVTSVGCHGDSLDASRFEIGKKDGKEWSSIHRD
jgi:hypothetical protein